MAKLDIDQLPPYGWQSEDFQRVALERKPPPDWIDRPGLESWAQWFDRCAETIRQEIWPSYTLGAGWDPGRAKDAAMRLTALELDLMVAFRQERYLAPALDHDLLATRNWELLLVEDTKTWDATVTLYCPELTALRAADLVKLVEQGLYEKAAFVAHDLKHLFQRPRAQQVAWMLDYKVQPFKWAFAQSSISPSMVSGHCLQGCVVGCNFFSKLTRSDPDLAGRCRERLQRWTTDLGDRRVMGGVHYPTDSIASWIVALRLIERVFDTRDVRLFLAEAIRQRSVLYEFLHRKIREDTHVSAVMAAPWAALQAELDR